MDKQLAALVLASYEVIQANAREEGEANSTDVSDVLGAAENSEEIHTFGEWCYLKGIADALDITILTVVEEARAV